MLAGDEGDGSEGDGCRREATVLAVKVMDAGERLQCWQ